MGSETNEIFDTSARLKPEKIEDPIEQLAEDGRDKGSGSDLRAMVLETRV